MSKQLITSNLQEERKAEHHKSITHTQIARNVFVKDYKQCGTSAWIYCFILPRIFILNS